MGKDVVIPARNIVQINCKTNVGLIVKQRAVIFQQRDVELAEVTHCADNEVLLQAGIKNYYPVPVINETTILL